MEECRGRCGCAHRCAERASSLRVLGRRARLTNVCICVRVRIPRTRVLIGAVFAVSTRRIKFDQFRGAREPKKERKAEEATGGKGVVANRCRYCGRAFHKKKWCPVLRLTDSAPEPDGKKDGTQNLRRVLESDTAAVLRSCSAVLDATGNEDLLLDPRDVRCFGTLIKGLLAANIEEAVDQQLKKMHAP